MGSQTVGHSCVSLTCLSVHSLFCCQCDLSKIKISLFPYSKPFTDSPMTPLNIQDPHQDITDPLPPGTLSSLHVYIIPSAWNSFPFPASGKPPSAGFCASSRPLRPHLNSLPLLLLCSNLTFPKSPYKITPLPFPYST